MSASGLTASLPKTLALSRPNIHSVSNRRVRVRRHCTQAAATFSPLRTDDDRIAEIPHLQSDHLCVQLFETVIDIAGHPVKLVLPESEDIIVDMYAALGRPDDDPHWATLWQGSVALAGGGAVQPRTGPRKAGYRSRDRARARRHRRWTRGCIRGSAYRSRAEDAVLRTLRRSTERTFGSPFASFSRQRRSRWCTSPGDAHIRWCSERFRLQGKSGHSRLVQS